MMRARLRRWADRGLAAAAGVDLTVLLPLLAVVGGIWAFAALADEVVEGDTIRFDERVLTALRSPDDPADPIGPAWFEVAVRDLTALGGVAVVGLTTVAVIGFLLIDRKRHAALLVAAATLGGQALSLVLKESFGRPRPDIVPHLMAASMSSFPSGHSLTAAVTYLTLGTLMARLVERRSLKLYVIGMALLVTALVGASRVYLGVHYPTDVLGGWAAGLAWAIGCGQAAWWLQRRGVVEPKVELDEGA